MKREEQSRFLILYALRLLSGSATKKEVLDCIDENSWLNYIDSDLETLTSRNELRWRNEFAFVRQHLVQEGYLSSESTRLWELTPNGSQYLESLLSIAKSSENLSRIDLAAVFGDEVDLNSVNSLELISDLGLENETVEVKRKQIKRYQGIVKKLKAKYQNKCQIKSCQFSFVKSNGEHYSEAHHLKPLSEGGGQHEENVVILCANHHRMLHYADVVIGELERDERIIEINGIKELVVYQMV
ncbi:winged helix-turn-helix domain-containing protein [Vibrio vulnificus]|uniref:winged helix-turn-helix domain-containing protein n=1 Tax=Vibrio vulnificus TaxID=672 RepID=UPI0032EF3ED5